MCMWCMHGIKFLLYSHFNVLLKVEMQIILVLWLFNPSYSKQIWLKGDNHKVCFGANAFSKANAFEQNFNLRKNIFLTWWDNIAWPIGRILLFKFCQIYPWWLSWKNCRNHYILISPRPLREIWNSLNLLKLFK
jgi:hypothetical protein